MKVKMIGKNYDVVLEQGKKVVTIKPLDKNGEQDGRVTRTWWTLEETVNYYEEIGFVKA